MKDDAIHRAFARAYPLVHRSISRAKRAGNLARDRIPRRVHRSRGVGKPADLWIARKIRAIVRDLVAGRMLGGNIADNTKGRQSRRHVGGKGRGDVCEDSGYPGRENRPGYEPYLERGYVPAGLTHYGSSAAANPALARSRADVQG